MMSPGDSDLQQRIISALINFFLQAETSNTAVQATLIHLSAMEQEYNINDNSSWTAIITSRVTIPIPFVLGRDAHLEKIKACRLSLENARAQGAENLGGAAIDILLEFLMKSDDWHSSGFVRGISINMRLTCELLKAAGIANDCASFLQKYSKDFLKELEAAANKFTSLNVLDQTAGAPLQQIKDSAFASRIDVATNLVTPLFSGKHKKMFYIVEQPPSAIDDSIQEIKKTTSRTSVLDLE
jgi:hypothetical protein